MANGADTEGKFRLLSKIRLGSKREFEFAMRTQSECGCLGRTRSSTAQSNAGSGLDGLGPHAEQQNKELKTYVSRKKRKGEESELVGGVDKEVEALSEEEAKSDVVDMVVEAKEGDDVEKDGDGGNGFEEEGLMNVVEGVSEDGNVEDERREPENAVVDSEKEKKSGVDEEKGKEEVADVGKLVIEFDKKSCDEFDRMSMEMEEDRREEKVVNSVQKDKFDESEEFSMDLEGVRCEEMLKQVNECEKANGGCVMEDGKSEVDNVVIDESVEGEKENEAEKVIGFGEETKNDGGSEAVENVLVEGSSERKGQNNLHEEGSSAVGFKMGGGTEEVKKENGVVEQSTRRFTRSMLKPKVEIEKKPAVKDLGKGEAVKVVQDGGDDRVATALAKRTVRKCYTKLKDFFALGILEGLTVKYMRAKGRSPGVTGLRGVIKGLGILCFCDECNGSKVVSPNVFEIHAGSSNRHPAENIYLENDKTLRDIMDVCKDSPLETLEEALRTVVGSSVGTNFCLNCGGPLMESGKGVPVLLCNRCIELKESQVGSGGLTGTSEGSPESKSFRRLSHSTSKSSSSSKLQGQITKKDLRKHKLVFEEGGLADGTEVAYFSCGKKILVGYKSGWGIFCSCCKSEVSPSQFEAHAGFASRRKPFHNIFMSNGVSLHELSIALSRERTISSKEHDDLCGMCSDGGNLLCCDTCPRAFHTECVSLDVIPEGAWYCRYCDDSFYRKERSAVYNANAIAAGRVPGVDPNRCVRIVDKNSDIELGGCVLCRQRDFSKNKFTHRTVMLCEQCEREYHVGCLKDKGMEDLKELPRDKWFCRTECKRINMALQKLIDRGEEKLPDASLNVLKKKHEEGDSDSMANIDVRWRVLRGNNTAFSDGTRALLSKAIAIFHDRFDPIIESDTNGDLIPAMAYGKCRKGQDYHGMYCAVLTVDQVVVSAGIFRIFGQEVAELPLVATRLDYAGQGYFQCLFSCFEKLLGFLHVKKLVLPSASEAESIWTNKFGFNKMMDEEVDLWRNEYPLMFFQGTSMLHKMVPKCRILGSPIMDAK